jgi:hypothetical protein
MNLIAVISMTLGVPPCNSRFRLIGLMFNGGVGLKCHKLNNYLATTIAVLVTPNFSIYFLKSLS